MKYTKIWGSTEKIFSNQNTEFHRIFVNKGGYCSTHLHQYKFNQFFVETGALTIKVLQNDSGFLDCTTLGPGESTIVDPGKKHMFFAEQDTVAYEIYWTQFIGEDIIRQNIGGQVKKNPDIYNEKFFRKRIKKYHDREVIISNIIHKVFANECKSVLDLGCGIGSYINRLKELNWIVLGCDKYLDRALMTIKQKMPDLLSSVFKQDCGEYFDLGIKLDLVMTVETAEHINSLSSDQFVDNLCRHSDKYILFTAAKPRQRGRGHINCRSSEFWIEKFQEHDFIKCDDKNMQMIIELNNVDDLGIKNNLIVFVNKEKIL